MSANSGGPGPPSSNIDSDKLCGVGESTINVTNIDDTNGGNTNSMEVDQALAKTDSTPSNHNETPRGHKRASDLNTCTINKVHVSEIKSGSNRSPSPNKSDYIIKAMKNRYRATDKGPFVVNLEGNRGNLGKVHRMALGKWLIKSSSAQKDSIVDISVTGLNRMKITTNTAQAANALLSLDTLKQREIVAYIPNFRVQCTGVIRDVDVELEDNEILSELISPFTPINIRRLTRKKYVNEKMLIEKLPICFIDFDSQVLPQHVSLYGARCKVDPYIPSIRQCRKCLRFRHSEDQCRSKVRCEHCSENHHISECPVSDAVLPVCIHCQGDHRSTYRDCPVKIAQNSAIKDKIINKISFASVTKNKYEALSEEEFPVLPETSSATPALIHRKPIKKITKSRPVKVESYSKQYRDEMKSREIEVDEVADAEKVQQTDVQNIRSKTFTSTTDVRNRHTRIDRQTSNITQLNSSTNKLTTENIDENADKRYIYHLINQIGNCRSDTADVFKFISYKLEEILSNMNNPKNNSYSKHNVTITNNKD